MEERERLLERQQIFHGGGAVNRPAKPRLRLVQRNALDHRLGRREIGNGSAWGMVAPRAHRVEVGNQIGRQVSGERFASELAREAGGQVLEHAEFHQHRVARRPGGRPVAEQAELHGQVGGLGDHGGVHSARVDFEPVLLLGRERGPRAVRGHAQLQCALQAVVLQRVATEDGSQLAGSMTAQHIHLPQAVLCGDEALGKDQVFHRAGADVRNALGIARHRHRRGQAIHRERAVEPGQVVGHGLVKVVTPIKKCGRGKHGQYHQDRAGKLRPAPNSRTARFAGCGSSRGGFAARVFPWVCAAAAAARSGWFAIIWFAIGWGTAVIGVVFVRVHGLPKV